MTFFDAFFIAVLVVLCVLIGAVGLATFYHKIGRPAYIFIKYPFTEYGFVLSVSFLNGNSFIHVSFWEQKNQQ